MSRTFLPLSIVALIVLSLLGGWMIVWRMESGSEERRIIESYWQNYRWLAKLCYTRKTNVECCLQSVSTMESRNATLIGESGCQKWVENHLFCQGGYLWCE